MPTVGFTSIPYADYNDEISNVRIYTTEIDATNFDTQVTSRIALMDAIADITLGLRMGVVFGNDTKTALGPAADDEAQREKKWLVQYHDNVTLRRHTVEIPCADTAQLDPNDRGNANIGDAGVVDAFVSAFEAYALSPAGNAVTVDEITLVGRNI
jgi:hypothetical protein